MLCIVGRQAAAWADDARTGGTCLVQGIGRGLAERVGRWKGWDDAAGNGLDTACRQAQNERFLVAEPLVGSSLASRVRCAVCAHAKVVLAVGASVEGVLCGLHRRRLKGPVHTRKCHVVPRWRAVGRAVVACGCTTAKYSASGTRIKAATTILGAVLALILIYRAGRV